MEWKIETCFRSRYIQSTVENLSFFRTLFRFYFICFRSIGIGVLHIHIFYKIKCIDIKYGVRCSNRLRTLIVFYLEHVEKIRACV